MIVIKMEENNNIFLAVGDALVYLAGPVHKKYSTTSVCGHPTSTYVSYDRFFNPRPPCKHMYAFRVTVTIVGFFPKNYFIHNRTYVLNNMTQMLQAGKNSNIKYDIIQVKLN